MTRGWIAVVLCSLLVPCATASATGVVSEDASGLRWQTFVDANDTVTVRSSPGSALSTRVSFTSAPTVGLDQSAADKCTGGDTLTVTCTFPNGVVPAVLVAGGAGDDTLSFVHDAIIFSPAVALTLMGQAGADTITGSAFNDTLLGGQGADTITGGSGADTIAGGDDDFGTENTDGGDVINGGPGADTISGEGGDDSITGGSGAETVLHGGSGADRVRYDEAGRTGGVVVDLSDSGPDGGPEDFGETAFAFEHVTGTAAADVITGTTAPNELAGGSGNDQLNGLAGADVLTGGAGDDTIAPGGGTDDVDGGEGTDTGDYSASSIDLELVLNGGGAFDDDDEGGTANDRLVGLEGLVGGSGDDDLSWTAASGSGAVTFEGRDGHDTLAGSTGDDTLLGGKGADAMTGGAGRDSTSYSDHPDGVTVSVDSGAGDDGSAFDAGPGGVRDSVLEIERIEGTALADTLIGGPANEELLGLGGDDLLRGGPGADILRGGDGLDTASYAERGAGEPVTVTLDGAAGDGAPGEGDDLGADVESVAGGAGADVLTGGEAANVLDGNGGGDVLTGGFGVDVFRGGAGDDDLRALDGSAEDVDCGDGNDIVAADAIDRLIGCETPNRAPTASFTVSPSRPTAGGTARFDASSSTDPDGPIVRYQWDLDGNGSFETDTRATPRASRRYLRAGKVRVALRVTDGAGATGEVRRQLTIARRPALSADSKLDRIGLPRGIRVVQLRILAPVGARIEVRCGRPCGRRILVGRARSGQTTIRRLAGKVLPDGSTLAILVTRSGYVGRYIAYRIARGNFRRVERCLPPGSRVPARRCE